ncbi:MAG TPA: MFS transporter, partial [Streptomyces sp.]
QLLSWGWRIPFLASFLLLVISLYVRRKVAESPLFVESGPARDRRAALVTLVTTQRGALFRGFLISIPIPLVGTLCGSFAISYAVQAGHSQSAVLLAFGVGLAVSIALMPLYGWLSDRLGRKPVYVAAALAFAVAVYPFFWALSTRSVVLLYLAFIVVLAVIAVAMQGALAAFLSELFPLRTRSTGVSVAYQAGGLIAGLAPVAAASLIAAGSGRTYVALLGVVFAVIAAYAAWRTPEPRGADLAAQQSKTFSRAGEYAGAPATEER